MSEAPKSLQNQNVNSKAFAVTQAEYAVTLEWGHASHGDGGGKGPAAARSDLAADVAGYSRLMGVDEEGTLSALKELRRELADPKIKEHRGRIVKTTGDGLLVEFASVVDAVGAP